MIPPELQEMFGELGGLVAGAGAMAGQQDRIKLACTAATEMVRSAMLASPHRMMPSDDDVRVFARLGVALVDGVCAIYASRIPSPKEEPAGPPAWVADEIDRIKAP